MAVTDPREEYDDLIEWHVEEVVDAEAYAEHREMEAFRSGWVAVGYVLADDGRLLLAYNEGDELWLAPGGTLQPGESLEEGIAREVREETGVEVSPVRPRSVGDVEVRNGDDSLAFSLAAFEAVAETTEVGTDLGEDGEAIADADWFDDLPEDLYDRERAEEILDRCERWEW